MFIEIKGVQFVNKGAELMLAAVIDRVREYWPDAEIVLEINPLSPYTSRAKLGAYQKLSLRKNIIDLNLLAYYLPRSIRNYLKKWGVVTEADIDIVLDASGFAYGDQWSSLKIKHLGGELKRAASKGKKYIFLPQALGPFTREQDRKVLSETFLKAALVCPRDAESLGHVTDITGASERLKQFPDFTNALTGVIPDYWTGGQEKVCFIPNNNMTGQRNQNSQWKDNYIDVFSQLIRETIQAGFKPVLLNHEGDKDRTICHQLNAQFDNALEMIEEQDPLKVKGILGDCKAVICSRFHGCVSSLSQGVACIGTSWSHKYEHLYQDYGVSELLINPNITPDEINVLMDKLLSESNPFADVINQHSLALKNTTEAMWSQVRKSVVG